MKYLVAILVAFLLLGSPTLAQETIPEPTFVQVQKPIVCGPIKEVMDKVIEFGELPAAAWIDAELGNNVMFYINENTGTTTVVEIVGEVMCIISQGRGGAVVSLPEKIKGLPIKHLTF